MDTGQTQHTHHTAEHRADGLRESLLEERQRVIQQHLLRNAVIRDPAYLRRAPNFYEVVTATNGQG